MDETTKAMIKDMLNRGMDNDTIMGVTGATQDQIDQVATEGKSSFLNNFGIFSTAQASEIDPNNPPSMLPTGAMDRETPFGDMLKPEVPRGGDIFSGRQFDQIRAGQPELGIFGAPAVQDLPVDFSELDDLEAQDAEYLDLIQKAREAESPGILQNIINNTLIGRGLDFLQDQFQYRPADASITSTPLAQFAFRNQLARDPSFDIGAALDRQNALGGYYSDFARGQRSLAGRFSNLLDRARSGKTFSERNLLGISRALGTPLTRYDISNITRGVFDLNTGEGPSGAGTFTAKSLSDSFAGEEGPVGGGTGTFGTSTNDASTFSDYS
jgi:hypothetical protein